MGGPCDHFQQVFRHLQEAGLKVNPKKGKLEFTELAYMGYIVV